MSLAKAANAPVEITVGAGVDEKKFRMSGLWISSMGEFERWAQERAYDLIVRKSGHDVAAKAAPAIIGLRYYSPEVSATRGTMDGSSRVVWLACRQNHPDLDFDCFVEAITPDQLATALNLHNILEGIIPAPEGDSKKKAETQEAQAVT